MATLKKTKYWFKSNYRLMDFKSIAECSEHSAILLKCIKLPFVIKIFVLSIFEWSFYTGLTVRFFAAVMAVRVKPCMVIVLGILFKHTQ